MLQTARGERLATMDCGDPPTPIFALAAVSAGVAAVLITGSHIPAVRNGLKLYPPQGQIAKSDEAAILAALGRPPVDTPDLTKQAVFAAALDEDISPRIDHTDGLRLKLASGRVLHMRPSGNGARGAEPCRGRKPRHRRSAGLTLLRTKP